jgi:DNA-binding transcriptional LysR family regulator
MRKTDYFDINGHLLRVFVLVYDTVSVSRAASQLNVNQSSVSQALERLRRIVGDPLFVRSGRGIAPTARADAMVIPVRKLLAEMERIAESDTYEPLEDKGTFTIAANDYEVEIILRPLLSNLRDEAPAVTLHIVRAYSQRDWTALLREKSVDAVLAPALQTDESDLIQQSLLKDYHLCLYDPLKQSAPETLDAYCAAPHAVMLPGRFEPTEIDRQLEELGRRRSVVVAAPSFAMLASLVRGTEIIATMPSRLAATLFPSCASAKPPLDTKPFTIAQIWHVRNSTSPRHQWLRNQIRKSALSKQ